MSLKQRKVSSKQIVEKEGEGGDEKEEEVPFQRFPTKKEITEETEEFVRVVSSRAPPNVKSFMHKAEPFIATAIIYLRIAFPYLEKACETVSEYYDKLPEKLRRVCIGFVLCFFGGFFPATIAAYEAWSICGGTEAIAHIKILHAEFRKAKQASDVDDEIDEDGNGIPDVQELSSARSLVKRKAGVVMAAIDPREIMHATSGLWVGWIGVLAVLKVQFAKTVTLGACIGQVLYRTVSGLVEPTLTAMIPEDKQKWVPVVCECVCKAFAISIAWWVQRVISAFHSAVRGGLMFGRGIVNFLHEKGHIDFDDKATLVDEGVGYTLAAIGFLFQLSSGFSLFFPLNILLLPFRMLEGYIVWCVSS